MSGVPKSTSNPNQSAVRHVRVPDHLWIAAATKAEAEGMRISEIIRVLLRDYVRGDGGITP